MPISFHPVNFQTFKDQFICPLTKKPLSEAVALVPCGDKVQRAAAEHLFGLIHGEWMVQQPLKACPVCKTSVQGMISDPLTRNAVKQLFAPSENSINAVPASMKISLTAKCLTVPKDILPQLSYPGKPARFVHDGGNWNLFNSGGYLCRSMEFKSSTAGSLLKKFSILGYFNGDVVLRIEFSKSAKEIVEYFKQFEIILDSLYYEDSYMTKNEDQLRIIFNIISENNEIPASHFNKIRNIIEKGKC